MEDPLNACIEMGLSCTSLLCVYPWKIGFTNTGILEDYREKGSENWGLINPRVVCAKLMLNEEAMYVLWV